MYYQLRRSWKLKSVATEAWGFCRKIRDYHKKLTPEVNPEVFTTKFGEKGIVIFTADFEDLNSMDAWLQKNRQDEGFRELLIDGPDVFDVNTWHDEVVHTF